MKQNKNSLLIYIAFAAVALGSLVAVGARQRVNRIDVANLRTTYTGTDIHVSGDIVLDSLTLGKNHSVIVTPVLSDTIGNSVTFPSILINGRNMHYVYERKNFDKEVLSRYDIEAEILRKNGTAQNYAYSAITPVKDWMRGGSAQVQLVYDTCGCGHTTGCGFGPAIGLDINPAPKMRLVQITPAVTELPITIHEGSARVQFEVDKTVLHVEPYKCKNGQRLDNRAQIAIIEDSIRYAISDPNVEIARVEITGYASPESPYTHNDYLATNRSRALVEYIADRFNLPRSAAAYSAVPENWGEFRTQVLEAKDITEQQRSDLLALIDAPTYGPADFDAKERTLKTDPRFAKLYASKILPEWFPHLRATKFAISTRLKPLSDEKLAEVILVNPQMLSLNQMMRVARLYPEGGDDFNKVIEIALKYYPNDPVANLNAAVTAIQNGDLTRAASLLEKSGDSPEAENARGVLAVNRYDYDAARTHFTNASSLPEAQKNLKLIEF